MVTLVIKNPARPEGFVLEDVPFTATIRDVQDLISRKYPGQPAASDQTLIYAGKVLKDTSISIQQLVAKLEPSGGGPFNFHLVIKQSQGNTSAAPQQAPSPPAVQASSSSAPSQAPAAAPAQPTPEARQGPAQEQAGTAPSDAPPFSAPHAEGLPSDIPPMTSPWGQGLPPYMYLNPIVATAYQAAYTAALAAGACVQQQYQQQQQQTEAGQPESSNTSGSDSSGSINSNGSSSSAAEGQAATAIPDPLMQGLSPAVSGAAAAMTALQPLSPWPMHSVAFTQAYLASMNAMAALNAQGAGAPAPHDLDQHQRIVQLLMASPGLMQYPPQLALHPPPQHLINLLLQQQGLPTAITLTANGEVANLVLAGQPGPNNAGARNRRNAAAAAMVQAAAHRPHRHRRQRVFTLRINMRTLLQLLVFGMVLYQHFTWRRLVILLLIAAALWVTSLAPLRRFVASLQAPPPPARPAVNPPQPQAPAEAAAAAAGPVGAVQGEAAAADLQPAVEVNHPPQPRGILKEIAVVLVGFMTSLLPAWNYNPEDAAAFAAAQDGAQPPAPQQQRAAEQANGAEQQPAAAGGQHEHQD